MRRSELVKVALQGHNGKPRSAFIIMTASARGTAEDPGRRVAQKRGLTSAILNVGWHRIPTILACKAARFVTVDPSDTSRTCASCGAVDGRSRKSQAVFV